MSTSGTNSLIQECTVTAQSITESYYSFIEMCEIKFSGDKTISALWRYELFPYPELWSTKVAILGSVCLKDDNNFAHNSV